MMPDCRRFWLNAWRSDISGEWLVVRGECERHPSSRRLQTALLWQAALLLSLLGGVRTAVRRDSRSLLTTHHQPLTTA
jgi:hypothetical protein